MTETFVGIDVSKDRLDVHLRPRNEAFSRPNDAAGFKELCERLKPHRPVAVVLEASGGYETAAAAYLIAEGLPAAIVNPRQPRAFARGLGILAKTDRIDARTLAHFAEVVRDRLQPPPSEETRLLQELVARRRQLVAMRVAESNRLRLVRTTRVRSSIEAIIEALDRQINDTDAEMRGHIEASPFWRAKDNLLRSVPGVGPTTAMQLIAGLPELGTVNRQRIAALVGVAPINADSGTHRGQRITWGGRAHVRSALYMAALVAVRHNPVLHRHYHRLLQRGKKKKQALTACMRKLVVILNAILKSGQPWSPVYD